MNVACLRKSVCLLMALLVLSVPLVACALPGEEMSSEEQDCCIHMSDECGSSQMSGAHTCCTKTPQLAANALKATGKYAPTSPELVAQSAFRAAPVMAADRLPGPQNPCDDSPSPPGSISILRI